MCCVFGFIEPNCVHYSTVKSISCLFSHLCMLSHFFVCCSNRSHRSFFWHPFRWPSRSALHLLIFIVRMALCIALAQFIFLSMAVQLNYIARYVRCCVCAAVSFFFSTLCPIVNYMCVYFSTYAYFALIHNSVALDHNMRFFLMAI